MHKAKDQIKKRKKCHDPKREQELEHRSMQGDTKFHFYDVQYHTTSLSYSSTYTRAFDDEVMKQRGPYDRELRAGGSGV